MAIYRFRLKDAASGERRIGSVSAESKEEAVAVLEAQEAKKVQFYLDAAGVADLEKKLKDGTLSGADKGKLFSHRQTAAYKIESVKKDGEK